MSQTTKNINEKPIGIVSGSGNVMEYKIVKLTDDSYQTTNLVYMKSPKSKYISIYGIIYKTFDNQKLQNDELSMNQLQRSEVATEIVRNESIKFFNSEINNTLTEVNIYINFATRLSNRKAPIVIEVDKLSKFIIDTLRYLPINLNQKFGIQYDDTPIFELTFKSSIFEVKNKDFEKCGFLTDNTKINIVSMNNNIVIANHQEVFKNNFDLSSLDIGGIDKQFIEMFRRAFTTRVLKPDDVKRLGLKHLKGILLYGPPGCGKTLIARKLCECLSTPIEPKIVNGPEVLNKYIGESEAAVRKLFAEAELDQQTKGELSPLHVIIFDEIDSICKSRGSNSSTSGSVNDSLVNQLLVKIDGVKSLNNVLIIGMTNRKDMIDPALLRPGRFELHLEITLPDEDGRTQILNIHTKTLRLNKNISDDIDLKYLAKITKNYTGAELESLVNIARSYALAEHIDIKDNEKNKKININNVIIRQDHFIAALKDIKPSFGVNIDELSSLSRFGIINYSDKFYKTNTKINCDIEKFINNKNNKLLMLLSGVTGTGKTALAVKTVLNYNFPFVRYVSAYNFIGMSENEKSLRLKSIFEEASKTPLSAIILDDFENIIEWNNYGPRFSNIVLQTLLALLKHNWNNKLLIITTTSILSKLEDMEINTTFNYTYELEQGLDISMINSQLSNTTVLDNVNECDDYSDMTIKEFFSLYN